MSEVPIALPYDDAAQQREAAALGMWIFLGTEVLFFGGLFVAYTVYRYEYPGAFVAGSGHLSMISGAVMTAVLLLGSLLVALSDLLIRDSSLRPEDTRKSIVRNLSVTAVLGVAFLGLEFHEYGQLINEGLFPGAGFDRTVFEQTPLGGGSVELFYCLFFFMTGLHAFHMIIGVALIIGMAITIYRTPNIARHRNLLENVGLYWHFVDIVWVFLFPLFYLIEH